MKQREQLIEDAAKAIGDTWAGGAHPNRTMEELNRARAAAALAVFEGAYTPTDDEREALIEEATWRLIEWDTDTSDRGVRDEHYQERRADVERVFPILFHRSVQDDHESAGASGKCRSITDVQGEPSDAQVQRLREAVFAQSQKARRTTRDGGLYYPSIDAAKTILRAAAETGGEHRAS